MGTRAENAGPERSAIGGEVRRSERASRQGVAQRVGCRTGETSSEAEARPAIQRANVRNGWKADITELRVCLWVASGVRGHLGAKAAEQSRESLQLAFDRLSFRRVLTRDVLARVLWGAGEVGWRTSSCPMREVTWLPPSALPTPLVKLGSPFGGTATSRGARTFRVILSESSKPHHGCWSSGRRNRQARAGCVMKQVSPPTADAWSARRSTGHLPHSVFANFKRSTYRDGAPRERRSPRH